MADKRPQISAKVIKAQDENSIKKSVESNALTDNNALLWLNPPIDQIGLKAMVEHSTVLPQCIRAYKDNIAGFGIGIQYKYDVPETTDMKSEYSRLEDILTLLSLDMDTKEVFEDLIEGRETFGTAYLEVIRNIAGEVNQIDYIKDIPSTRKTAALSPAIEVEYFYKDQSIKRSKKFCKYKQEKNGKAVYFKEFGDTRIMDKRNGQYVNELEIEYQANEILEFGIGTSEYGAVRWIGQSLNIDGSRRAEVLNNNYFKNGRHTPLMIVVRGGSLSDDSFTKLQEYMNGIKGEAGQHAFMVLEVEDNDNKVAFEQDKQPSVEIKDMASILQKDELFQDYLDNSRKKIQSAFRLPDLYVGYTTEFNRATAQTAQEVTEKQVFIPERKSLAWAINNKLLNEYQFKHVEVYFKEPDITNPDDVARLLNITERAGGLTPNVAKEITLETLGRVSEVYTEPWGDIPVAISKSQFSSQPFVMDQLEKSIQKAASSNEDNIVAVMKEVRSLLLKMNQEGK